MARPYVFWRAPDGRSYKGVDGKCAPREMLASLGKMATRDASGKVAMPDFDFLRMLAVVSHCAVIVGPEGDELNGADSEGIVRGAFFAAAEKVGGGKPIDHATFIELANGRATEYYRIAKTEYVLVASLSVASLPGGALESGGRHVQAVPRRGDLFPLPQVVGPMNLPRRFVEHSRSTKYKLVTIQTAGRSVHEAAANAIRSLALIRGFWNLFATFGRFSISFDDGVSMPAGAIVNGPLYTLHEANGKPVDDLCWTDPDYADDHDLFKPSGGWDPIENERLKAVSKMRKLPYRRDLEEIIIRYADAMAYSNSSLAFLEMWSILEKITDTVGAQYDKTIDRAVWVFADRGVASEALSACRLPRLA